MKKRAVRHRFARSALVVLGDGSCLWFPRVTVKRSRTEIRLRTADGVDVVVPAAGTNCVTCDASKKMPEEIAQQKRVRAVFDPEGRFNPAKVFPLEGRAA